MAGRHKKITERQLSIRAKLWPEITDKHLWNRKQRNGFSTIPRNLGLLMTIMDQMSKGKPVSSTYAELWCRTFDEMFVSLAKPRELATHSGFSGERAERTWRDRMKRLEELGFIKIAPGASGAMSHALILNPYHVIETHRQNKTTALRADLYNALRTRAEEIGENSLDDLPPLAKAKQFSDLDDDVPF